MSIPSFQEQEGHGFPSWPQRLLSLAHDIHHAEDQSRLSAERRFYILLHTSLSILLRSQVATFFRLTREDLEDMAADRSLYLMQRLKSQAWDLSQRTPYELYKYLSQVARSSLIKGQRRAGRSVALDERSVHSAGTGAGTAVAQHSGAEPPGPRNAPGDQLMRSPEEALQLKRFAKAFRRCLNELKPRSRNVWILKIFGGLSAVEIARHPRIQANANQVHVIFHRCCDILRKCISRKGYAADDVRSGVFAEILKDIGGSSLFTERGETND